MWKGTSIYSTLKLQKTTMTEKELNSPHFPSIIAEPIWDNEVQYFFDAKDQNERLQKADGKVKVEIQLGHEDEDGKHPVIPFKKVGNPTINIRLIH